jgi:superfamily II DNA or RNA helicase
LPARGRFVLYRADGGLPTTAELERLGLGAATADTAGLAVPDGGVLVIHDLPVRTVPLRDGLAALLELPLVARTWGGPSDSFRSWALAARLALGLVVGHRVVPDLARVPSGYVHAAWRAEDTAEPDWHAARVRLAAAMPPAAHALARSAGEVWTAEALIGAFLDAVADAAVRFGGPPPSPGRPRARLLPWTARWVEGLTDGDDPSVPLGDDAEELLAAVAGWRADLDPAGGVVELRLRPPGRSWWLAFGVRAPDGRFIDATDVWSGRDGETRPSEGSALTDALLVGLARAARLFPQIEVALREPAPAGVELDAVAAWTFVDEAVALLEEAGLVTDIPDGLDRDALGLRARIDMGDSGAALVRWEVTVDGQPAEPAELAQLAEAEVDLVAWGDGWIRIDRERIRRLQALQVEGRLAAGEAVSFGLAGSVLLDELPPGAGGPAGRQTVAEERVEVVAEGALAALLDRIAAAPGRPDVPPTPKGFVGELRPYQQRGVAWLVGMGKLSLGAVLADDMGLGKTVQLIAYLLMAPSPDPALVVCPTSVVGNWERELGRFAPSLPVTRYHGPDRRPSLDGVHGVVVTTYGTLRRDVDVLARVEWGVATFDEAQQLKNPGTAAARAARRLRRRHAVAMTGTPLENRLAELWAILDLTNPGLLGTRARFGRRFAVPIERHGDRAAARRLRRMVAPFVLRRTKSDPSVIRDLPDKIERTVVCALTPEQARLYEAAVAEALGSGGERLQRASSMERRGRVLALLTVLKQICNHPAQYLSERAGMLAGRSGKLAAAREIVAEAVSGGERVLLFTQYVAMARLLQAQLTADLGVDVPVVHGGVTARRRDAIIDTFQSRDGAAPVLVVSLRAGGTGVNLTAATHVVHYDRWWNPAVEDQATDRAHRIGQRRTVEVHRLVTAGTVEERIAALLDRKRELAETVVGEGEAWVTELSDDELLELVALAPDADVEEVDDDVWFSVQALSEPALAPPADHSDEAG